MFKVGDLPEGYEKRMESARFKGFYENWKQLLETYPPEDQPRVLDIPIHTDIPSIPLKDAPRCPIEEFLVDYYIERKFRQDIPLRKLQEEHGKIPKPRINNWFKFQCFAIKHENPDLGFLHLRRGFKRRNYETAWDKNIAPLNLHTKESIKKHKELFLTMGLYDKGFWLYPVAWVMVKQHMHKGRISYIDKIADKDAYANYEANLHPLSFGVDYLYILRDRTRNSVLYPLENPSTLENFSRTKSLRLRAWNFNKHYLPFWWSKEYAAFVLKNSLRRRMIGRIVATDNTHLFRYTPIVGKPVYIKSKEDFDKIFNHRNFSDKPVSEHNVNYKRYLEFTAKAFGS